jgi:hypothetical protein
LCFVCKKLLFDVQRDQDIVILVKLLPIIAICVLIGGCTHYEFDVIRPPELKRHIGPSTDEALERGPLVYRLTSYENRLVMRVYNTTDDPIELLGAQSVVVDPSGQSHPMPRQTIAPHSFIKMIFPPIRQEIYPTGPSIGFGISSQVGRGYDPFGHYRRLYFDPYYDDPYLNEPAYLVSYDEGNYYWEWDGETEIRLMLVYQAGEKTLRDDFVFRRVKVK